MKEKITLNNINSLFNSLSPIQALSSCLPAINTLISSCIIGNTLGQSALASMGFAGPFNYIVLAFANIFSVGSQLLCSKYMGEGNEKGINKSFNTAIFFCTVFGLFLTCITFLFPEAIAGMLGAKDELRIMTADYIKGYSLCCLVTVLLSSTIPFLQLDCAKFATTACIVSQIVLNVGFNVLNSFVLHWGMLGVGLASSVSAFMAFLIGAVYFRFKSNLFSFSLSDIAKREGREILVLGVNSALLYFWLFLRDRIFNQVAFAIGGTVIMSAFTVANNVSNTVGIALQTGISGPCNIIAGVLVGERDIDSLRKLPKLVIKKIYPLSVICYVAVFFLSKPIALLFGAETENIAIYVMVMRIFNLYFLTNPPKTTALSVYSAMKKVKECGVFTFLGLFAYPVLCLLVAKFVDSAVLLISFSWIPELLITVSLFVYYVFRTHTFKLSLSHYIYIDRSLFVPKEDCLALTVDSLEDTVSASQKVIEFCKSKGISEKNSYYCGLCLEELAADTVIHGFGRKNRGKDSIDVRIIHENGHISIMLRDTCPHFDPKEWLDLYSDEDPTRSIGLKMVRKLASEMTYSSNLGLNVVTIKI